MGTRAKTVYASDISYGLSPMRRGHWADRLPAIDADMATLEAYIVKNFTERSPRESPANAVIQRALNPTRAQGWTPNMTLPNPSTPAAS